jgi:hypothetical protein
MAALEKLHVLENALGEWQKKKPRPGETGASLVPLGGTCGEKLTSRKRPSRLMRSVQIIFPYAVHKENLCRPVENEKAAKAYGDSGRRPAVRLVDYVQLIPKLTV